MNDKCYVIAWQSPSGTRYWQGSKRGFRHGIGGAMQFGRMVDALAEKCGAVITEVLEMRFGGKVEGKS